VVSAPLFTGGNDTVDFNQALPPFAPGSQFDAGAGDDVVTLPGTTGAASGAGFGTGTQFSGGLGNDVLFLNGNEYIYSNGCSVTPGAPSCGFAGNFRSQLKNNKIRVDFTAPVSFNKCFPFDGNLNSDCSAIFYLYGANFSIEATGPGPVTLTISDTRIAGAVPEPASWALLIAGFGLTGAALRRRRTAIA
jgi:hypothetical protein